MFGAPFQGAKFRLVDGAVDQEPHLEMQNSRVQLASPRNLGLWAWTKTRTCTCGSKRSCQLVQRWTTTHAGLLTRCLLIGVRCEAVCWTHRDDCSMCTARASQTMQSVASVTCGSERNDAVCNWSQLSRYDRCSLDSPQFQCVLCLFLWRTLYRLQWNFGSA